MGEQKKPKADKRTIFNRWVIIIKIGAACILLFCCFWFFFKNMKMFGEDFTSYLFFFPIIFFAGIVLICVYISMLVGTMETNSMVHSDRFDIGYRIVFTVTLLALTIRSFFTEPMLNVPITIIALAIASGIITWAVPKIKDNDTADF